MIPPSIPATAVESANVVVPNPPTVPSTVSVDVNDVHQTAVAPSLDPEILRFTRMLAVGVPLMAVEQKMRAEGYDPSLLNSKVTAATNRIPVPQVDHSSSDETLEESNSDED